MKNKITDMLYWLLNESRTCKRFTGMEYSRASLIGGFAGTLLVAAMVLLSNSRVCDDTLVLQTTLGVMGITAMSPLFYETSKMDEE